jgi:archaeal flagellar protein FlaI
MISKRKRIINKLVGKLKPDSFSYVKKQQPREQVITNAPPEEGVSLDSVAQQIQAGTDTAQHVNLMEAPTSISRIPIPARVINNIAFKKDVLAQVRAVNETYNIVQTQTKMGMIPLAHANIMYNPELNQLQYNILEPKLDAKLTKVIDRTVEELHDRLEIDLGKAKDMKDIYHYINKEIDHIWKMLNFKPKGTDSLKLKYHIFREAVGLGKIDAILRDPNIEDISCDGIGLPIYIYHRNPLYGEIRTNVKFDSKDELDSFAMRLAQKCNKTISIAAPLVDGTLPDGSRVQITYGTDIARRGSNFTIRKFFHTPLTPVDLIKYGTTNAMMLAYLWLAIEREKSILISGTTATGKTTLLNILSLFIEPNLKIVSIEDTAELQIQHTNWMPQVTRSGFGATGYGEVSMYDLLTAALRQRPDYLIVGEVRGKEANVLFHAMSTGHPGLSTIHADNINAVIDRLTTRPIDLPVSLLENLDLIIFIEKTRKGDKLVRRIDKIIEVEGYDARKKILKTNTVFEWDAAKDVFNSKDSYILKRIGERAGLSQEEIHHELMRRVKILSWMQKSNISDFATVSNLIHMYYINPQQLEKHMK